MFIIEIFSSKDENWKNYLAIPGYYSSIANDYPVSLVERRYLLLIVKARTLRSVYTLPIFFSISPAEVKVLAKDGQVGWLPVNNWYFSVIV